MMQADAMAAHRRRLPHLGLDNFSREAGDSAAPATATAAVEKGLLSLLPCGWM